MTTDMSHSADPFFEPYDRKNVAYGDEPTAAIAAFLDQVDGGGRAIDLGAGAGRDTVALAAAGFDVTAVDLSGRGLERIHERAKSGGVANRVTTKEADVRDVALAANTYNAIVATTVLDHIPAADAMRVWGQMTEALTDTGMLFVEVHTTEDPGSPEHPGCDSDAPISETAGAVINYFRPNQLASWAVDPKSRLRVLRYEERQEWDYTHGPEHLHGKAILLAVREGFYPDWFGQPAAFPRNAS
ncbi:Demethylrebeccamycin-D-glucose O-methyltransferase [Rubripirellula tenax]|uniref:Demethylrebeccamycin-D-glucose O-methyltransferase n=1 Tax=Rubripirellula tenax TaxID=2528015 RepID=A0A5C6FHT3_9BACT|nr:class I SAM-dependent methyltransferase [Rubripirellula tenax]TWU59179.1 Demethylrebeccamycin-D-glucose O-methyltransferase [Rubripirellula tenax]